jgi:NitT/TauT family transport system substrate-binding protein
MKKEIRMKKLVTLSAVALSLLFVCVICHAQQKTRVRLGYFPNITHSQALIGTSKGMFQEKLGDGVVLETKIFNAGPSVIEALFAGEMDISYIGPNPAINGYVKSEGEALRIVAGATSGGAGLVVRADSGIKTKEDFHGRKIASPQLGNTQDVALRGWLKDNGLKLKDKGGDVQVMPIANPDQLTLFIKKEIDAAWTVEPWVTRLIKEGNGKLFIDERELWPNGDFVTAHIIVSKKFLDAHPDIVKKFLEAHVEVTVWINENMIEAKKIVNTEIKRLTGKALPEDTINEAFSRLKVTYDPIKSSLFNSARWAFEQGFLGNAMPDLSGIYDLKLLKEVLKEKGLAPLAE